MSVHKGHRACLASKGHRERKGMSVHKAHRACLVNKACKGHKEMSVHKALKGCLVNRDCLEILGHRESKGRKESKATQGRRWQSP